MKTVKKEMTIRELVDEFEDNDEDGVVGYGGALDIRPPYQRAFVYNESQRDSVMESIVGEFPIGIMYWTDRGDGRFEVLDGQQRTISICQLLDSIDYTFDFTRSGNQQTFKNLKKSSPKLANRILDYPLLVYTCEGEDAELMQWFKRINIAGLQLTTQEIRNAIYHGPFVTEMKRYFSTPDAGKHFTKYMNGRRDRQELLERGIKWSIGDDGDVDKFMARNRENKNNKARDIHRHALDAIEWAHEVFGKEYHKSMKSVDWGGLYRAHGKRDLDCAHMASEAEKLQNDYAVTNKHGIYPYLLSEDDSRRARHLNVRLFDDKMKQVAFDKQGGNCATPGCDGGGTLESMDADHVTPWSKGGATDQENCQLLCKPCNQAKGNS